MEREILELFKVMVVKTPKNLHNITNTDFVSRGVVLNFTPTGKQIKVLDEVFAPLNIKTLFTREERDNADPFELITKQILHYIEVYGLGMPGLFDLEVTTGTILTMNYVRGITVEDLGDMVRELLYSNAPVKDATVIEKIIAEYKIDFDINDVENNELRVILFDVKKDTFTSGDDAVRYMVYMVTGDTLLIKSDEVIAAIKSATIPTDFLERHVVPLAQVFNRHKRLIIAAKKLATRTVINHISRLSKTKHVPIKEAINKTFIHKALSDHLFDPNVLAKISVRDKFKYLNLLAFKREQLTIDAFIIRNGKIHLATDRKVWDIKDINRVEGAVLISLSMDLAHLKDEKILLDPVVSYGLPISRKQAMGQLPFGTRVHVGSKKISSGMYWRNEWGATDLDLSTVDVNGSRTGWGQYSGYDKKNPITYSGDVTFADTGAMEFMTSAKQEYGLFVNIYSGKTGCEMEIIVGEDNDNKKWISKPIIREKIQLNSRGNIVGFVRDTDFIVYSGRLGGSRVQSQGKHPIIARGLSKFWTVNTLFDAIDIEYDVDKSKKVVYKYDVSYDGFSFDKLEGLLL